MPHGSTRSRAGSRLIVAAMPEEIEVPTEHLHEKMEEEAHEAAHAGHHENNKERAWISRVAVSSAILAVAAAISALLAGHHANEAMLEEMLATDQWALFQAKGIKSSVLDSKLQLLAALGKPVEEADKAKVAKYSAEQEGIKEKADELEHSSEAHMGHHNNFARAVTIYQIAIALGAIAVLARKPKLWFVSLGLGLAVAIFLILGIL
jgi:hypothetical protein